MERIILKVIEVNVIAGTVKFDEISKKGIKTNKVLRISEFDENLALYSELIALNYKKEEL